MKLKELSPDLFGDGIPTIIYGNDSVEKSQKLKPAYEKKGLVSQVLFVDKDENVVKAVVSGWFANAGYCEEKLFSVVESNVDIKDVPERVTGRGVLPPEFPRPSAEELNEFKAYIAKNTWKSSKTMANFSPHQYIINYPCWKKKEENRCSGFCDSCKRNRAEFERWALFIRKYGERQKMLKTIYTVFCVDDRQYWTMGDPMNTTWVLNRALIEDPNRVPKLYWLDRV